jgi:hypothetical protein
MQDENFEQIPENTEELEAEEAQIQALAQNLEKALHFQPRSEFSEELRGRLLKDLKTGKKAALASKKSQRWHFGRHISPVVISAIAVIGLVLIRLTQPIDFGLPDADPILKIENSPTWSQDNLGVREQVTVAIPAKKPVGQKKNLVNDNFDTLPTAVQKRLLAANPEVKTLQVQAKVEYKQTSQ